VKAYDTIHKMPDVSPHDRKINGETFIILVVYPTAIHLIRAYGVVLQPAI